MRILYLFPEPLPLPKARAIQVLKTVNALAVQGIFVHLAYVPVLGVKDPFEYYGIDRFSNIQLVPLSRNLPGVLNYLKIHSNKFFLLRVRRWLQKAEKNGTGPQYAFVRHLKLAAGLIRICPGLPVIYEAHEIFADTAPPRKQNRLARLESDVVRRVHLCVAITENLANGLKQRYSPERQIAVVPSATDVLDILPSKDWSRASSSILYAGSFFPWKGVDDLVVAAKYLPNCKIEIVGGDSRVVAQCRALQDSSGAEILFSGQLSHTKVQQKMFDACIAVLPNRAGSVSEFTSPLKLFEYMSNGCALVVSDLPVFHEVLEPDDAFWFISGDPVSLAGAIQTALSDPIEMARRAQKAGLKVYQYSWTERAAKILRLLAAAESSMRS